MITSWFVWEKLCHVMNNRLHGETFRECYSYVKNELVIENENPQGPSLRIHLDHPFSFIFLETVHAPIQKVLIFPEFNAAEFIRAEIMPTDRDIQLIFNQDISIIIQFRPPKSNIYFQKKGITRSFKKTDEIKISLDDTPRQFSTLAEDPRLNDYWKKRLSELFPKTSWTDLQKDIARANGKRLGGRFVLLPEPAETFNPNTFYDLYRSYVINQLKDYHFKPEKKRLMVAISSRANKVSQQIHLLLNSEEKTTLIDTYRTYGSILMAILSDISPGHSDIQIPETLRPKGYPEKIPLKPELSPQANAEYYFKKARKIERSYQESLETQKALQKEYEMLREKMSELATITTLKALQTWEKKNSTIISRLLQSENPKKRNSIHLPYREYVYHSWRIWVGKSAKDNDEMSFHYAHKRDLWLHTRYSTGSHVIIRREGKSHIPRDVIEYAASLAARYSEEKHASLVSVVCTERKYITKRKGDPPGKVVFTYEKNLLIKPLEIE